MGEHNLRLQQFLHLLHCAVCARQGAFASDVFRPRRGQTRRGRGLRRDNPARAERELLRARPDGRREFCRAAARHRPHRRKIPRAVYDLPSQGPDCGSRGGDGVIGQDMFQHPSPRAVRVGQGAERYEPPLYARKVFFARFDAPRSDARHRHHHGRDGGVPHGERGRFPGYDGFGAAGAFLERFHFHLFAAWRHSRGGNAADTLRGEKTAHRRAHRLAELRDKRALGGLHRKNVRGACRRRFRKTREYAVRQNGERQTRHFCG